MKPVFAIAFLLLTACSSIKSLSDEDAIYVQNAVISRNFSLIANHANPQKGSWISLIPDYYSLTLRNDSAIGDLPYYGRIKSGSLVDTRGHLKFAAPVEHFKFNSNKKNTKWKINFNITTENEVLDLLLKVKQDGSSKFTINSEKRDSIVYKGFLK